MIDIMGRDTPFSIIRRGVFLCMVALASLVAVQTLYAPQNIFAEPPTAVDDSFSVDEDNELVGDVLANDFDIDNDELGVDGVSFNPSHGVLIMDFGGTFVYTPDPNFFGTDIFEYVVVSGSGDDVGLAIGVVTIEVLSVNDAPIAEAGADQDVNEGDLVTLDGTGSTDIDGTVFGYSWVQTAGPAVVITGVDTPTPSFTVPEVDSDTLLTFQLIVIDDQGANSTPDVVNVIIRNVPATISDIQQAIDDMKLSQKVSNPLLAPLKSVDKVLNDSNPDNDGAACGKLDEFIDTVIAKELAGQLDSDDAAKLIEDAEEIQQELKC